MEQLPPEVLRRIFSYVDPWSLAQCERSCQKFRGTIRSGSFRSSQPRCEFEKIGFQSPPTACYNQYLRRTEPIRPGSVSLWTRRPWDNRELRLHLPVSLLESHLRFLKAKTLYINVPSEASLKTLLGALTEPAFRAGKRLVGLVYFLIADGGRVVFECCKFGQVSAHLMAKFLEQTIRTTPAVGFVSGATGLEIRNCEEGSLWSDAVFGCVGDLEEVVVGCVGTEMSWDDPPKQSFMIGDAFLSRLARQELLVPLSLTLYLCPRVSYEGVVAVLRSWAGIPSPARRNLDLALHFPRKQDFGSTKSEGYQMTREILENVLDDAEFGALTVKNAASGSGSHLLIEDPSTRARFQVLFHYVS